jgi:2-amino-4-hydroxy-6-hydroxymethyldihydropteridine diphosphokinase
MIWHLGLGSNQGDRLAYLRDAVSALQAHGFKLCAASSVFETSPVGCPPGTPAFLNAVVACATGLEPTQVLHTALQIEQQLGRVRNATAVDRTLDIDLLCCGDRICDEVAVSLPHPRLHERLFVLEPLCQLAPELVHPRLRKSMAALLAARRITSTETVRLFAPSTVLTEHA